MKQRRVTMADGAAKLGVSRIAVSMALRDHHRISLDLSKKVQRLAREMGFVPDPFLSALAAHRRQRVTAKEHGVLAWINHWQDPKRLRQFKEFDLYWRGASAAAVKFGYRVDGTRGATRAIYGFALSYGYTRNEKYLETAVRLAKKFIANLDEDVVPWNDFHEAPHPDRVRDASAGAIAVCGFQELAQHHAADPEILQAKNALLDRLCSDKYLDFDDACCGVQKRGQGGKNGCTSWGDYYLMEAVTRELKEGPAFW